MLNTPTLTYHDTKSEVYTIGGAIVRDSTLLPEGRPIVSVSHFSNVASPSGLGAQSSSQQLALHFGHEGGS